MLSAFTSFLPSSLHVNSKDELPRATVTAEDAQTDDEDDRRSLPPERAEYAEQPSKGRGRDGKGASETFVFVRPPPAKSNHPLNLQIQLVPPNARPPTGVGDAPTTPTSATSTMSTATASDSDGTSLRRTPSNRSQTSSINNSSTTSFSSIASTSTSSGSSRRAIIPLYNLQAHNVMTNVIVDAGTDAKIAKFQKRGIELIDLAILEPVEVWGERDGRGEKEVKRESMRLSVDDMGAMVTNLSLNTAGSIKSGPSKSLTGALQPGSTASATSSAISLHSQSHSVQTGASPNPPSLRRESPPNMHRSITPSDSLASLQSDSHRSASPASSLPISPGPQAKRNIFGKLFKRNTGGSSTSSTSSNIATPMPSSPSQTGASFASFALHPAPTSQIMRDASPQVSKFQTPRSPMSSSSQQTTPTASQTPKQTEEPLSPTPTIAPTKGHGRNISLTGITTPIKATLKSNKNRFSGLIGNTGSSPLSALGINDEQAKDNHSLKAGGPNEYKRDVSPNPSVARSNRSRLSWMETASGTVESHSTESSGPTPVGPMTKDLWNGNGNSQAGYALMHTQTQISIQAEGAGMSVANLRQQQLQLRPPILGIQPTFVSSSPSTAQSAIPGNVNSPLVMALSPRVSEKDQENVLAGQRALMYVWLVRRWLKKRQSAILSFNGATGSEIAASVGGFFGGKKKEPSSHSAHVHAQEASTGMTVAGGGPPHLPYGGVEVRFEWKRAKTKESKKGGKKRDRRGRSRNVSGISAAGVESDGEVERSSVRERSVDIKERLKKEDKKRNRMSTGSFGTTASRENVFDSVGSKSFSREPTSMTEGDDGDESDPEDSETPWVCTLKVRRSATAATVASASNGLLSPIPMTPPPTAGLSGGGPGTILLEPQILRIKVGTLSPTPHHPKVVAMLKVPYPLPDVEVERMAAVKRVGMNAQDESEEAPYNGLTLTAEEIKDIVCSTGLWVVVREGFGGVGKVSRKGDGWRIRA